MNRILFIVAAATFFLSCEKKSSVNDNTFHLSGDISGFNDSTRVYLIMENGGSASDSTVMVNGKFEFSGVLPDSVNAKQIVIHTRRLEQYKFIWIEKGSMTIHGDKDNFRQLIMEGSKTESENAEHGRRMAHSDKLLDSLARLAKTASPEELVELRKQRQVIFNNNENIDVDFIRDHPASMISANLLKVYTTTWGKAKTAERFSMLTAENQNSDLGKAVRRYLDLSQEIGIGDKFIDFEERDLSKNKVRLSDFNGKVVLLEFWAAWCGPCREGNPTLRKTYYQFKGKGFEILAVSLDESEKAWKQAMETDSLTWINVSELNGSDNSAALIYGVNGIPDNFLIDKTGVVVARGLRGDELTKKLSSMLN